MFFFIQELTKEFLGGSRYTHGIKVLFFNIISSVVAMFLILVFHFLAFISEKRHQDGYDVILWKFRPITFYPNSCNYIVNIYINYYMLTIWVCFISGLNLSILNLSIQFLSCWKKGQTSSSSSTNNNNDNNNKTLL